MSDQQHPTGDAVSAGGDTTLKADNRADSAAAHTVHDTLSDRCPQFLTLLGAAHPRLWLIAAAVTGDRTEADDVLQDAAMIGLSKFADFIPGSNFEAWMGQITRNVALNALRKRTRATAVLNEQANAPEFRVVTRAAGHDGDHSGPMGKMEELAAAVAELDDVARTCLLLRVVGGLPYQAIAAIVQIPESTAMSHVFRSRGQLRQWLMQIEGLATPGPQGVVHRLEHRAIAEGLPRTPGSGVVQ